MVDVNVPVVRREFPTLESPQCRDEASPDALIVCVGCCNNVVVDLPGCPDKRCSQLPLFYSEGVVEGMNYVLLVWGISVQLMLLHLLPEAQAASVPTKI